MFFHASEVRKYMIHPLKSIKIPFPGVFFYLGEACCFAGAAESAGSASPLSAAHGRLLWEGRSRASAESVFLGGKAWKSMGWDGYFTIYHMNPYEIWWHMFFLNHQTISKSMNFMAISPYFHVFLDGFMINRGMDPVNPQFFEEICWDFLWPGFTKGFLATHRKTQQTVADGQHSSVERMGWIGWSFCAWTWFWF